MSQRTKLIMVLFAAGMLVAGSGVTSVRAETNWRLGMQAYSFNRFTFYEAVEKNKALGMEYIEAYPGQKLSAEHAGRAKYGS